jgi:hypothetical protein
MAMNDGKPMTDIRRLKDLARTLPPSNPLRATLLAEDDVLEPTEFVFKAKTWLKLLEEASYHV